MFKRFFICSVLALLSACDRPVGTSSSSSDGSRYAPHAAHVNAYGNEAREDREEINQAKREVIEAQQELSAAWRSVDGGDWREELRTVARRLRDLEDANDRLTGLDSTAAAEMDWEVRRMKTELGRLDAENWRYVVPDLDARSHDIEQASMDIEASIEE